MVPLLWAWMRMSLYCLVLCTTKDAGTGLYQHFLITFYTQYSLLYQKVSQQYSYYFLKSSVPLLREMEGPAGVLISNLWLLFPLSLVWQRPRYWDSPARQKWLWCRLVRLWRIKGGCTGMGMGWCTKDCPWCIESPSLLLRFTFIPEFHQILKGSEFLKGYIFQYRVIIRDELRVFAKQ